MIYSVDSLKKIFLYLLLTEVACSDICVTCLWACQLYSEGEITYMRLDMNLLHLHSPETRWSNRMAGNSFFQEYQLNSSAFFPRSNFPQELTLSRAQGGGHLWAAHFSPFPLNVHLWKGLHNPNQIMTQYLSLSTKTCLQVKKKELGR